MIQERGTYTLHVLPQMLLLTGLETTQSIPAARRVVEKQRMRIIVQEGVTIVPEDSMITFDGREYVAMTIPRQHYNKALELHIGDIPLILECKEQVYSQKL